jgi:YD repeat-containing protein
MIKRMKTYLLVFSLLLLSFSAQARINPDNGNFDVKYTDFIVYNSGMNVEFSRTYNSRSAHVRGFFGVGWSSQMEGYLQIEKEKISFYEGGGGNLIRFEPVKGQAKKWSSDTLGKQHLTLGPKGYVLENTNGLKYLFEKSGRLSRIADNNNNHIEFVYGKNNVPEVVKDSAGNQVKLEWKVFGAFPRIVQIKQDKNVARFEYNKFGNLIKAEGMDGVPYTYSYDDEHNLIKISYQNGTYKQISYNKVRDWAVKFRDIDGATSEYEYFADSIDPENKFGTIISQSREGSSDKEQARFWFEFRRRPDGSLFKYRSVTMMRDPNNLSYEAAQQYMMTGQLPTTLPYTVTETFYTQCCGTPLTIAAWNEPSSYNFSSSSGDIKWTQTTQKKAVTKFDYYTDGEFVGFLKKKVLSSGESISLTYKPTLKKIAELKRGDRAIAYDYDKDGNPIAIVDQKAKKRFVLAYGMKGEISSVKEFPLSGKNARLVYFRYNAEGLPVEIKEKFGKREDTLQVSYLPNGRINQILNSKGRSVASREERDAAKRISETFTNLVELLKPSGLSLGPEG